MSSGLVLPAAALVVAVIGTSPGCLAAATGGEPGPMRMAAATQGAPAHATSPSASSENTTGVAGAGTGESVAPPPRTISDITAILDQERPDAGKVAAAKSKAAEQPSPGLDAVAAARFYIGRAAAAGEIGLASQQLADLRKALDLLTPQRDRDHDDYGRCLNLLAIAEARMGHLRESVKLREQLVAFAESTKGIRGMALGQYYSLTTDNVLLGNMVAARAWLDKGEALLARAPYWTGRARKRLNLFQSRIDWARASYLSGQGKLVESEAFFRKAIAENRAAAEDAKTWDVPPPATFMATTRDFMLRGLALNLARQGRLIDAEIEARRALLSQLHMRGRYSNESAQLLISLGFILAEQGRSAEAETLERVTIDTFIGLGHAPNSFQLNGARRNLADALVAQQRWADAMQQFDLIRQALAGDAQFLRHFLGFNLNYVMAAVHLRQYDVALAVSQRIAAGRAKVLGDKHYNTAEARGFHAVVLAATGDRAAAVAEFAAAVPILLQSSRQTADDESTGTGREFRLHQILEGYLAALADQHGASGGASDEAFRIADAARGRSVQRALTASAARAAVKDPGLVELVRREQDAEHRIASLDALISNIVALPSDQQTGGSVEAIRAEIDQLRGARATIRQDIERRFPDYINLIDPKPATIAETQRVLRDDEALIATYVAEDRTYVWAVPKRGPAAFAAVPLKRAELADMVARLRRALDPNATTLGEIPPFDVGLSYRLYATLFKPVMAGWRGAKSVLVVPHGVLGQLPLALLVTAPAALDHGAAREPLFAAYKKVPWLIRDAAVTELPSVASLVTLRATPAGGTGRRPFIGFGDPWFSAAEATEAEAGAGRSRRGERGTKSGATVVATRGLPFHRRSLPKTETVHSAGLALLPRLPDTADEVREVALALRADPQTDVFTGSRANERVVRTTKLDDRRVVMFATHGLVPGDLDGLTEPALALTAPQVAGVPGDGLLTTSKILGLRLNADWVVLSACNTAAGNGAGAEAVSGLGLAFFYAGTRAVLVSNWPVETTSARALTTGLFRREAAGTAASRAEALRQAMLELIDGPGFVDGAKHTVFSYAHPIFWAPFSLVGDGGSREAR